MRAVPYSAADTLPTRFINHARLGLQRNIGEEHRPNFIEKIGNLGLWPLEVFPKKVWNGIKDPRVITPDPYP